MKTIAFFFLLLTFLSMPATAQDAVSLSRDESAAADGKADLGLPPAATLTVTKTADTNDGVCNSDCSLREAIAAANAAATDDIINFDAAVFATAQTITLSLGELTIANNGALTINGTGANLLTISGNNASRVFNIAAGASSTINGVTISGGNPGPSFGGAGIVNDGTLNLTNSAVSGNSIGLGTGAGIYSTGTLNLTSSTVSGNSAGFSGGGIWSGGTLNLTNSTINGNSGSSGGGGIYNNGGTVNITNSTISGNSTTTAGGGIANIAGTVRARNTIISGNSGPSQPDLSGVLAVNENNLIGGNAGLQPLGNYGGTTQTRALTTGSAAINAGNNCVVTQSCATFNAPLAVTTDQRGRLRDSSVDIGAFEFKSLSVTKTADTNDGVCDADCSLREAIAAAQSGDTIQFASPLFDTAQTIQTNGQLVIDKALVINGRGANLTAIQNIAPQSSTSRIFLVDTTGNLTLSNVTVTGGNVSGGGLGGGILTRNILTLINCQISGNATTGSGGGVGDGVGINDRPTTFVMNSSIVRNQAQLGGGIYHRNGSSNIINSTVSGNQASVAGGGVQISTATVNFVNATITANSASFSGGLGVDGGGTLTLRNSIAAQNIANTGPDLGRLSGATVISNGNNLIGNSTNTINPVTWQTSDTLNQNPLLAPLGFYGGSNQTHALLSGSLAINGGNNCVTNLTCASSNPSSPLTTDQRGAARVGNVDIGAFELNSSANGGTFRGRLPDGLINAPYNFTLVPSNGTTSYAVTGGALPPGMNLTTALAPNAVVSLTGTPTVGGIFNFTVTATNGANTSVTDYRLDIVNPTAAGVSVSGRVITSEGRGLANAVVILTDANGESRSVRTGSFGFFRFDDVAAGQTVVVEVRSKRFSFAPQVVFVGDEVANLEFVGDR